MLIKFEPLPSLKNSWVRSWALGSVTGMKLLKFVDILWLSGCEHLTANRSQTVTKSTFGLVVGGM